MSSILVGVRAGADRIRGRDRLEEEGTTKIGQRAHLLTDFT